MTCVRPPSMYRPRKRNESTQQWAEMCLKNTITNCAKNSKQTKKTSKAQQLYKMTDTKIPGKQNFKEQFQKKFSPKMEKEKTKTAETKIVELFTVSFKIRSSSCARQ